MCWRHAPREYAAIHFHDDDLHDVGWETDFEFTVPADLPSGAYLMRLTAAGAVDELPFYVRPLRGRPGADVLFVASTYTYQAYANHARNATDAPPGCDESHSHCSGNKVTSRATTPSFGRPRPRAAGSPGAGPA